MKKLIFILFIFVFIWVLLQLYQAVAAEKVTTKRVVPYLNDTQIIPTKKRMLLVDKNLITRMFNNVIT